MEQTITPWTDHQINELFLQTAVPLDGDKKIYGITQQSFLRAARIIEHNAHALGVKDGMDNLTDAIKLGIKTTGL